jgi:nucleoside-diphosphate-sugar epimerase
MRLKIIVTGGTGFIGAAVVAELVARDHAVTVLVRPGSDLARLDALPSLEIVRGDSLAEKAVRRELGETPHDAFVHCAWRGVLGQARNEPWQITENLRLTLDALDLANACGCRHWLSLGSQAEYGNGNCRIDENFPVAPTTVYGRAKLLAGQTALALCEARGIAAAVVRIFSTYGPGDAPAWFIPYIVRELLSGNTPRLTKCEQLWDYLYIEDAARAIAAAVEARVEGVYNLGSDEAYSLRSVVEQIRRELNTEIEAEYGVVPYRPDQVMHLQANISRLRAATGWAPTVSLEQGLQRTVAFERTRFHQNCHHA